MTDVCAIAKFEFPNNRSCACNDFCSNGIASLPGSKRRLFYKGASAETSSFFGCASAETPLFWFLRPFPRNPFTLTPVPLLRSIISSWKWRLAGPSTETFHIHCACSYIAWEALSFWLLWGYRRTIAQYVAERGITKACLWRVFQSEFGAYRGLARVSFSPSSPQNCRNKQGTFTFCAKPWYAPKPGSKEI